MKKTYVTKSPAETLALGYKIGKTLEPGSFVALIGDLGSGKTVFTKGIAKALGVGNYHYVNSPSFVIVREYKSKTPLYHFDVYRLGRDCGLETIGYEDYFYGSGVTVVEWADNIKSLLPRSRLEVRFEHRSEKERQITVEWVERRTA